MICEALIICQLSYPGDTRPQDWAYRTINNKQCWYQGPRMLPKKCLYWAETPAIAPPMTKEGEFELRWKGAKPGWDHKE